MTEIADDAPAPAELTADDIAPETGFEVVVKTVDGKQIFEATIYYTWAKRHTHDYYDGRGTGATFTEAASAAIRDAEGEDDE